MTGVDVTLTGGPDGSVGAAGTDVNRGRRRGRLERGVTLGTLAVLALGACAEAVEPTAPVVVIGEAGAIPSLEYEAPLVVESQVVEVIWEGTGPRVADGQPILVNFYAEQGDDGTVINETYSSEPKPYLLTAEALGHGIYTALSGQRVGSRVLFIAPPEAGQPSATIAVFDLMATRASGEEVPPREGLPTVTLAANGAPVVVVPDEPPPLDLVVQPLIRGTGPQVSAGQVITVQYLGVTWEDGTEFESSWGPRELPVSFPIGVGSLIEGWDNGLVEQTVGSQVLLIVPPHLGYGGTQRELADQTLVFVVDILATSGGPAPTPTPTPTPTDVPEDTP